LNTEMSDIAWASTLPLIRLQHVTLACVDRWIVCRALDLVNLASKISLEAAADFLLDQTFVRAVGL